MYLCRYDAKRCIHRSERSECGVLPEATKRTRSLPSSIRFSIPVVVRVNCFLKSMVEKHTQRVSVLFILSPCATPDRIKRTLRRAREKNSCRARSYLNFPEADFQVSKKCRKFQGQKFLFRQTYRGRLTEDPRRVKDDNRGPHKDRTALLFFHGDHSGKGDSAKEKDVSLFRSIQCNAISGHNDFWSCFVAYNAMQFLGTSKREGASVSFSEESCKRRKKRKKEEKWTLCRVRIACWSSFRVQSCSVFLRLPFFQLSACNI